MFENSRCWRPRFRLASLLWLMLCVALTIGTYRWAYERGHEEALAQRTFVGRTHARNYDLQDVLPVMKTSGGIVIEFDPIMEDLRREVLPNTWVDRGGSAVMAEFPATMSLVISHDDDGHERIAEWLRRRREQLRRQGTATIASVAKNSTPEE